MVHSVYLSTGSNAGDKLKTLRSACKDIAKRIGKVRLVSSVYESEPWGFDAPEYFYNQMLVAETELLPEEVLAEIGKIEREHGRTARTEEAPRYTSRTLDIDIIFYDNLVLQSDRLTIPHPRLHRRLFVLLPLAEIAPDMPHPLLSQTASELLAACTDSSKIKKLQ